MPKPKSRVIPKPHGAINALYIYTTPKEASVVLTLDTGTVLVGQPCTANGRDDAHFCQIPFGASGGARLDISCTGYLARSDRGLIVSSTTGEATFQLDDVHLTPEPAPVPPTPDPPTPPSNSAEAIIDAVYATGDHDLSTHDGCGQFTEACCTALHDQHSESWGHIRKTAGQNQFNGHAVDALMLLTGPDCGIYDIVHDSVSPNASPQCIYKGPPDNALWYYPA